MKQFLLATIAVSFLGLIAQAQDGQSMWGPTNPAPASPPVKEQLPPGIIKEGDQKIDVEVMGQTPADPRAKVIKELSVATPIPAKISMILDSSGSMGQILEKNQTKLYFMKKLLKGFIGQQWKLKNEVGVRIYGARKKHKCDDIEFPIPYSDRSLGALENMLEGMASTGMTPLHRTLEMTFDSIVKMEGPHKVVIITDGEDTCGGDPCKTAEKVREKKLDVTFYVIALGFQGQSDAIQRLKCLDENIQEANSEQSLSDALGGISKSMNQSDNLTVVSPNPEASVYLYRIENGKRVYDRVFLAEQTQYLEPGRYEAVVNLKPPYKFGEFEMPPGRRVTLKVTGDGNLRINFFNSFLRWQLLDKDNKVVIKGRSDQTYPAPIGKWRLRVYRDPFFENIIPDYFIYPNGDHQYDVGGLGVFRVDSPNLNGMYVYDQTGEVLGHELTGNPIVIKAGVYNVHVDEKCTFPKTQVKERKEVLVLPCK